MWSNVPTYLVIYLSTSEPMGRDSEQLEMDMFIATLRVNLSPINLIISDV